MKKALMRPDQLLVTTQGIRAGKTHTNRQGSCRMIVKKGFNEPENSIWLDVFTGIGEVRPAETASINISFADGKQWNGDFSKLQKRLCPPATIKNPLCTTTRHDQLKARLLEIAEQLLTDYENDIESGISDGTYEEAENIDTRKFIAEAKEVIEQSKNEVIEVLVFVEGGMIQGASATNSMEFTVFDKDNYNAGEDQQKFIDIFGTPDQWDKLIKDRTEAQDITPIF